MQIKTVKSRNDTGHVHRVDYNASLSQPRILWQLINHTSNMHNATLDNPMLGCVVHGHRLKITNRAQPCHSILAIKWVVEKKNGQGSNPMAKPKGYNL